MLLFSQETDFQSMDKQVEYQLGKILEAKFL